MRNRAEGSDRWELEQYRGDGDWYLVDSVARMESEMAASYARAGASSLRGTTRCSTERAFRIALAG